jgi:hypothetical protein
MSILIKQSDDSAFTFTAAPVKAGTKQFASILLADIANGDVQKPWRGRRQQNASELKFEVVFKHLSHTFCIFALFRIFFFKSDFYTHTFRRYLIRVKNDICRRAERIMHWSILAYHIRTGLSTPC